MDRLGPLKTLRVSYRVIPVDDPPSGMPDHAWVPILNVAVALMHKHTKSRPFEAVVDSGSPFCFFHSSIGEALGMRIQSGTRGPLAGVVGSSVGEAFYHKVKLVLGGDFIDILAGFCPTLTFAAILGRHGFFENFVVTFSHEYSPPGMEIARINRV